MLTARTKLIAAFVILLGGAGAAAFLFADRAIGDEFAEVLKDDITSSDPVYCPTGKGCHYWLEDVQWNGQNYTRIRAHWVMVCFASEGNLVTSCSKTLMASLQTTDHAEQFVRCKFATSTRSITGSRTYTHGWRSLKGEFQGVQYYADATNTQAYLYKQTLTVNVLATWLKKGASDDARRHFCNIPPLSGGEFAYTNNHERKTWKPKKTTDVTEDVQSARSASRFAS